MAFDLSRFDQTQYNERIEAVKVPELAAFFAEGEAAEWIVRGLTAEEIARTREAVAINKAAREEVSRAQGAGASAATVSAVKTLLGLASTDTVPDEHVQHLNTVTLGSVSPAIKLEHAVKLATVHPIIFTQLYQTIYRLTGAGHEPKKP